MADVLVMSGLCAVLLVLGAPVFVALGVSAAVGLLMSGPLTGIAQIFVGNLANFTLLPIPLYILLAELMGGSGMADRLVRLLGSFLGHLRGGLAIVAVLASAIFAAFSGSSPANAAALGVALLPRMVREGYDPQFAAGLIAAGGTLGILIPPSINMILYSAVTDLPVLDLFRAGIVPGIILTALFALAAWAISHLRRYPLRSAEAWETRWMRMVEDGPVLLLPAMVLGGMYTGVFTVTEAALGGLLYILLLQAWYRCLEWRQIYQALVRTAQTTSMIYLIIGTAAMFAHVLTLSRAAQLGAEGLGRLVEVSPVIFLLAINLFLILLGDFLDVAAITYIVVPIIDLTLLRYGLDRIQFAIMFVLNMELALITPPIGLNTFILSSISRQPVSQVLRGSLPFCVAMLVVMAMVGVFPWMTRWGGGAR